MLSMAIRYEKFVLYMQKKSLMSMQSMDFSSRISLLTMDFGIYARVRLAEPSSFLSTQLKFRLLGACIPFAEFLTNMGIFSSFIRTLFVAKGEVDKIGIISGTSKDLCNVLLSINGSPKTFSFGKEAFYFWGYQCEGDMTNILDEGTEVNVCLRIPQSQDNPTVAAVWIGDKPEVLYEPLVAVFGRRGYVDEILDDGAVVIFAQCLEGLVIAKKEVIHRDSLFEVNSTSVKEDEPIMFDALPMELEHPSGAIYEATCAWTGREPRLIDRFSLRAVQPVDQKLQTLESSSACGAVVVIPNDVVAFAKVENDNEMIMVFRSSFKQTCESIHDIVSVGDRLCMQVGSAFIFRGRRQLFATKACTVGEETDESIWANQADLSAPAPTILMEPKSFPGRSPLRLTGSVEEHGREVCKETNEERDKIVDNAGSLTEERDRRVVTNGLSSEERDGRTETSSSSAEELDRRVDNDGSLTEERDRRVGINGMTTEERAERIDTIASSAEELDRRVDNDGSLSEERDRNGLSTEEREGRTKIISSPAEELDRRVKEETDSSSIETGDPKKVPLSFDLNGSALYREPPLSGVIYTKKTLRDSAMIDFEGLHIYVSLNDVYIDGQRCRKDEFCLLVSPGDNVVNFEAVRYRTSMCKMNFTHYTTCVWVGKKPSLTVVASSIWDINDSILRFGSRSHAGKVENFYFPDIALLSVKAGKNKLLSVVCLHLSDCSQKNRRVGKKKGSVSNCISNFVEFQAYVEFKVRENDECALGLCAYDVKKSTKLAAAKVIAHCANFLRELENAESSAQVCPESASARSASLSPESGLANPEVINYVTPFTPSICLVKRSFLLNGLSTLSFDETTKTAKVEHIFGSSVLGPNEYQSFRCSGDSKVGFDAEFVQSATIELCVKRVWKYDSLKRPSESILASEVVPSTLASLDTNQIYRFVITSIPYHDCAIAEFSKIKVIVPLVSIVTSPEADPNFSSIGHFLSVGDHVGLKVEEKVPMQTVSKATACYKLDSRTEVMAANPMSWRSVWESGEYFRNGRVKEQNGTYLVEFVSTKLPDTKANLTLSEVSNAGKLYVDGKPFLEAMSGLKDREISFHAACRPNGNPLNGCDALFIKWAWIGDRPLLPNFLKNRTVAPIGLICWDWLYEGVVRDFPLPTHAICQVGFLSVLLPLSAQNKDGDIVGVVKSHLKEGDRVLLNVKEQFSVNQAMLVASLSSSLSIRRMYAEVEVLVNVRGKVVSLPRPRGKIKLHGAPVDVWFDRSVVLAVNGETEKADIFKWAELIDASIRVGTEVYFSAAKDLTWNKWYRVYEMRVGNVSE